MTKTNSREDVERLLEDGANEITYLGTTITIIDNAKGWTYHWDGSESQNLDEVLDAIETEV